MQNLLSYIHVILLQHVLPHLILQQHVLAVYGHHQVCVMSAEIVSLYVQLCVTHLYSMLMFDFICL
jgi:hypothetical protein